MESPVDPRCDLSQRRTEKSTSSSISRKLRCGVPMCGFNSGSRCILVLMILSTASLVHSYMPEKYPIEVYHMLQERSQYGIGRDNRVRGSWGPWSSWSECSRSCGTGVQSQARQCGPPRELRKRSLVGEGNTTSPKHICIGTYKRYHVCNTHECVNYSEDPRAEQCAKYNNKMYKGESYTWVPFLNAPNPCALNCRALGQRFYATLEPEVVDGTPCDGPNLRGRSTGLTIDRTEQWLCVAGQCRPVGCDGVVGSGAIRDTCGVCGGQGRGCKLFEGIFMEPILPKGHQPVTTIPRGAMSLNISELRYTGNFLALRAENGSYVINGPNSVSPSGVYKTAGTILKYQRGDKNRMESIAATGPLNESLGIEILYHEVNPGVLYKYMLPAPEEIPDDNAIIAPPLYASGSTINEVPNSNLGIASGIPVTSRERQPEATLTRNQVKDKSDEHTNEEMKFSPTTVMAGDAPTINSSSKRKKKRKFAWKIMGLSPCTKTCGGGMQNGIFKCIRQDNEVIVADRRCRKFVKPEPPPPLQCNERPCPARWRADTWSECSVTCGTGVKTRRLECVQDLNSKLTMRVAAGACSQPPDLSTVNSCTGPPCPSPEVRQMSDTRDTPPRWDVGVWSPCSSTCGKGIRNRTVTCITTHEPCSQSTKPADERSCETPCNSPQDQTSVWLYSEWSSKCMDECDHEVETRRVACGDVNEAFCDASKRPVTQRPCSHDGNQSCGEPKWFTGPWSSCSVLCGDGIAHRDVICIGNSSGESKILFESNCTSPRPHAEQICHMPACVPEWYMSDWNECSASCNGGVQGRIVRCIGEGIKSGICEMRRKPIDRRVCNTQPCRKDFSHKIPKKVHSTDECTDKYPNCELVVKAGLCRIKYYKHSCCGCHH